MIEVKEGTVVVAFGGFGGLRLEEGVEGIGGCSVDRNLECDGFARTGSVDAMGAWGHILKFLWNFRVRVIQ